MTLILSAAYKDQFAFITSDSRVISQYYRLSDFERVGEPEKADITCEKVLKITDYVLFSSGGNGMVGDLIEEELKARVKQDDDLHDCSLILGDIIEEFRERKGSKDIRGLLDKHSLSFHFLDKQDYFGCCMVGFYKNGRTG